MSKTRPPCRRCSEPRAAGRQLCTWHALDAGPLDAALAAMDRWRAANERAPGFTLRARVPKEQWPAGRRWCSDCQGFVPTWFCSGSKCRPHARRAARAGHVERTYGIAADVEEGMRRWQRGRCFICGRSAVKRQLAVDHDHVTGDVRGLLCSGKDMTGCNQALQRILGDLDAARRLLAYVEKSPLRRYLDGEPGPFG